MIVLRISGLELNQWVLQQPPLIHFVHTQGSAVGHIRAYRST